MSSSPSSHIACACHIHHAIIPHLKFRNVSEKLSFLSRNSTLWTPLDCAAAEGWTKTGTVLLNKGSPVDPLDKAKVIN